MLYNKGLLLVRAFDHAEEAADDREVENSYGAHSQGKLYIYEGISHCAKYTSALDVPQILILVYACFKSLASNPIIAYRIHYMLIDQLPVHEFIVICVSGEPVAYFGDANGYTNFEVS